MTPVRIRIITWITALWCGVATWFITEFMTANDQANPLPLIVMIVILWVGYYIARNYKSTLIMSNTNGFYRGVKITMHNGEVFKVTRVVSDTVVEIKRVK
jgi:hypothetical protein